MEDFYMKLTFNKEEFIVNEMPYGKMIVEIETSEGFFLEDYVFSFILPIFEGTVNDVEELKFPDHDEEEKMAFLNELINLRILLPIE